MEPIAVRVLAKLSRSMREDLGAAGLPLADLPTDVVALILLRLGSARFTHPIGSHILSQCLALLPDGFVYTSFTEETARIVKHGLAP